MSDHKPTRYLVTKRLSTLLKKLIEKVWRLEFVHMEEFYLLQELCAWQSKQSRLTIIAG